MSNMRNLYLYLVSFVSLLMIIIGIIITVQTVTDVIFPTNYYYESIAPEKTEQLSEEDKTKYDENQTKFQENRMVESKKNVVKSLIVVIVALPTFAYHWRKIEKEKIQ